MKESDLQKQIVSYLRSPEIFDKGFFVCHIPNQLLGYVCASSGGKGYKGLSYYESQGYVKGIYDLIIFNPFTIKQFLFIELKTNKGKMTDSQKAFEFQRNVMQKWKDRLFTVNSFECFLSVFHKYFQFV